MRAKRSVLFPRIGFSLNTDKPIKTLFESIQNKYKFLVEITMNFKADITLKDSQNYTWNVNSEVSCEKE